MYVEELKLNHQRKQQLPIGTPLFPCMCYDQYMDQLNAGEVPWHWQSELEFFVILEGRALAESQDAKIPLEVGEGIFVNTNTLHRVTTLDGKRCKYYSILFWPELLYGVPQGIVEQKYVSPVLQCRELGILKLDREIPWQERVLHYVDCAHDEFYREGYGFELLVRENFTRAWYYFVKNTREIIEKSRPEKEDKQRRLKEMITYIYEHYGEPINVAAIAGAAGISESECFRCFKSNLGISPVDFLVNHRIRTAAAILRKDGKSVTEICYEVGFNNPSYFTKCFREILGLSPREYRKRLKEEWEDIHHDL